MIDKIPFWNCLNEKEKDYISQSIITKRYKNKELIFSGNDECLGFISVEEGIARVYIADENGNTATLFRLRKNQCCVLSMGCIFDELDVESYIEAEGDCTINVLPVNVFNAISNSNMAVENYAYRIITEKFSYIVKAMQQLLFMSLEQRVASFIVEESERCSSNTIKITHEQLSQTIGSAREAVSRVLSKLTKEGVISSNRGKITIIDREKLNKI